MKLARINYDLGAATVWSIYAQRIIAGELPANARGFVWARLSELRNTHPPEDRAYCDAYEAHVKKVFGVRLEIV